MKVKAKITVNVKAITKKVSPQAIFTDDFVSDLNTQLVDGIVKPQISAGLSPVRGWGRFVNYKNPDRYPGNKKAKRPVNLSLSGALLSFYRVYRSGLGAAAGIKDAPKDVMQYAVSNNLGTDDIPARRIVPLTSESETYSVTFMSKLKAMMAKQIAKILNQG